MGCPICNERFMIEEMENSYSKTWVHDMIFYICKRCGCEYGINDREEEGFEEENPQTVDMVYPRR